MTEHSEQVAIFDWAKLMSNKYPDLNLLYAIPNGGKRHITTARKLKREGSKSGMPDMCLPVSRFGFNSLYIELKSEKGSLSQFQKQKAKELAMSNNFVACCYGYQSAIDILEIYINKSHDRLKQLIDHAEVMCSWCDFKSRSNGSKTKIWIDTIYLIKHRCSRKYHSYSCR